MKLKDVYNEAKKKAKKKKSNIHKPYELASYKKMLLDKPGIEEFDKKRIKNFLKGLGLMKK